MSRFHFRLDSLLRIRKAIARQEEARLATLVAERARLEADCARLGERRSQILFEQQRLANTATDGAELQFAQQQACAFESCVRELQRKLLKLEPEIRAQQIRFAETRQEVEKLEHLERNALEIWKRETVRYEQQTSDELFLIRSTNVKRQKL